jgi:hypothetical protein
MPTFRVHLADGEKVVVDAKTPADARSVATAKRPGAVVSKIKLVKENA